MKTGIYTITGNYSPNFVVTRYDTYALSTVWSGGANTAFFRNSSADATVNSSNLSLKNARWTSPQGTIYSVTATIWCSFGTKSNQSGESGDRAIYNGVGWSGHLKHASWTGNFSADITTIARTSLTVRFNGSDMGAYYGKGHIKAVDIPETYSITVSHE